MKFNQMPQQQGKLPTLLGSTWVPVGRDEDLDAVIEKVAQKLGESGLPHALKFMHRMFGPMAETLPNDITNRCRWWETAWKRTREPRRKGGDECTNIPEAQKFSHMASLLVHEVYMLDDAMWCAIKRGQEDDPLIYMLDDVRQGKEDPSIVIEDCVVDTKDCYPAGQVLSPDSLLSSTLQLKQKENLRGKILGICKALSDPSKYSYNTVTRGQVDFADPRSWAQL